MDSFCPCAPAKLREKNMNGKISRLPQAIREELNRRLADAEPRHQLLAWINSLPDVKSILTQQFAGRPVSRQNLYEWTQYGFRYWKMRQDALKFAASNEPDDSGSAPVLNLTDKLVQWLALRFAAIAHSLVPDPAQPEAELRHLRNFAADVVALRRSDLYTRRIGLEERRVALLEADDQEALEDEFWQWTKRPDIREKLSIERDKTQLWQNALRAIAPEVAPYLPPLKPGAKQPDETLTPAALI